jgi:RNA polymerase sigma factor (sigma-70 family)
MSRTNRPLATTPSYSRHDLHLLAGGDERAFERLFFAYKNRMYEIALIYTESKILAEEVVQDIFMKTWIKREELPAVNDIYAWLYTLSKRRAFQVLRNNTRHACASPDFMAYIPGTVQEADEKLQSIETRQLIAEAMDLLSGPQRQAFQLIRLEALSREKAAALMGISPNTIKVHLHYGIKVIRAYLIKKGGYFPLLIFFCRSFI